MWIIFFPLKEKYFFIYVIGRLIWFFKASQRLPLNIWNDFQFVKHLKNIVEIFYKCFVVDSLRLKYL